MNFDIDSLASNIVFQNQYNEFFKIIDDVIKKRIDFNKKITKSIKCKESGLSFFEKHFQIFKYENIDQFFEDKGPLYWYEVFCNLINQNDAEITGYKIDRLFDFDNLKYQKFVNNLISSNINKLFELYELSNDVPTIRNFINIRGIFCEELSKYFKSNFEKIHDSFGGFLMLSQNLEIYPNIINIYETLPQFQKYFNECDKINKNDYSNFRKFWYYLIKFQKIPIKFIFKFLKNFEDDEILKFALNTTNHYNYYWGPLEMNKSIFNKLKIFNLNNDFVFKFNKI